MFERQPNGGRPMLTVLDLLDDAVTSQSRLAFGRDEPVPFAELWRRAEAAADWFSMSTDTGDVVLYHLGTDAVSVVGLLGAWRAGLVVASLPDPARLGQAAYDRLLDEVVRSLRPGMAILPPAVAARTAAPTGCPVLPTGAVLGQARPGRREEIGGFVQLTSGSTRAPDGVRLSLEAIAANLLAAGSAPAPRAAAPAVCSWLPLSHDMGLFGGVLSPLASAARDRRPWTLHLIDTADFARRPTVWLRTCSEVGASVTLASATGLDVAARLRRGHGDLDLSGLETCIVGAEPVRAGVVAEFLAAFADADLSASTIRPAYGLAENTLAVTIAPPRDTPRLVERVHPSGSVPAPLVSCGPPIEGTEVRIVDTDGGAFGEIAIRGTSLFDGYTTTRSARMDDGWFLTGDAGSIADGELVVAGRLDDTIVTRGLNLQSTDLEDVVAHVAPANRGVVAVAHRGTYAFVIEARAATDVASIAAELRAECVRRFAVAPSRIVAVARRSLPRTPSGKLRRSEVRARLEREELDELASV